MTRSIAKERPLYLKRLRIQNARCFKDVDVSFQSEAGEARPLTVVLGANGAGKSTLLRALAIGLCRQREASALIAELAGDFVRVNKGGRSATRASIIVDLLDGGAPGEEYRITTTVETHESGQELLTHTTIPSEGFPWHRVFACGYGVNRGGRKKATLPAYSVRDAVLSLFKDDAPLLEPEAMLRAMKLAALEKTASSSGGKQARSEYEKLITHLKVILRLNPNHKIEVTSEEVLIHGPWGAMPFHALGDGYRGTSGWLLDLFANAQRSGRVDLSSGLAGIVLIDEVDEHLHPSWQRSLVTSLKKRFPRVQFVATTHSPLAVINCDAEELLVCRLHNAVASIHRNLPGPEGKSADELLRGEWFGLTHVLDDRTEKLLGKYRKLVDKGAAQHDVDAVRGELRQRMGRLVMSPLDELAAEVVSDVRREIGRNMDRNQRADLKKKAAAQLRRRLREGKP